MKKIPTLFERVYEGHKIIGITDTVTPGMEWVLEGKGIATIKVDGSCCAIIDRGFYKRYDAKAGRLPPKGAIACCSPDPVTGHWPHWVLVDPLNPADRWFVEAYTNAEGNLHLPADGTYEAIGPHFQKNPYGLKEDRLTPHGVCIIYSFPRTFEGMKEYLRTHDIEGIVFWKDDQPQCKIKRSDFGFAWPPINKEEQ